MLNFCQNKKHCPQQMVCSACPCQPKGDTLKHATNGVLTVSGHGQASAFSAWYLERGPWHGSKLPVWVHHNIKNKVLRSINDPPKCSGNSILSSCTFPNVEGPVQLVRAYLTSCTGPSTFRNLQWKLPARLYWDLLTSQRYHPRLSLSASGTDLKSWKGLYSGGCMS
jgi:hypothetical protein